MRPTYERSFAGLGVESADELGTSHKRWKHNNPVKGFAKGQGRGQHPLKRPGEARGTGRPCEGADHPPNTTAQRKKEFLWHHQGGEEGW